MLQRTVVVAVGPVHVVQVTVHQVVHMIPVRHGLVTAVRAMDMLRRVSVARVIRRAVGRIRGVDIQAVLVHVIGMGMV